MLDVNEAISLKQCLFLFIDNNISNCVVWTENDYKQKLFNTKGALKTFRLTAALEAAGYDECKILNYLSQGKYRKIYKEYKKIAKVPLLKGSVDELSSMSQYWNKKVIFIRLNGIINKKLLIIIAND